MVDDPSAGPVFSQERIGRNGKPFKFYKFRSMCPNAEAKLDDLLDQNEMDGPVFKIKDDPRITRVGKFIRKTSLDELPQLWNILVGDMAVIGPRPALWNQEDLISEREWYGANSVRPGLTGWAQIHGRDELPIREKAELDGYYVHHIALGMDLECLCKTAGAVLRQDGIHEGMMEKQMQKVLMLLMIQKKLKILMQMQTAQPTLMKTRNLRKIQFTMSQM